MQRQRGLARSGARSDADTATSAARGRQRDRRRVAQRPALVQALRDALRVDEVDDLIAVRQARADGHQVFATDQELHLGANLEHHAAVGKIEELLLLAPLARFAGPIVQGLAEVGWSSLVGADQHVGRGCPAGLQQVVEVVAQRRQQRLRVRPHQDPATSEFQP